jgi:hypothetical protein
VQIILEKTMEQCPIRLAIYSERDKSLKRLMKGEKEAGEK